MGLFRRRRERSVEVVDVTPQVWVTMEERIEVVGESHYQPAIRAACGWKGSEHDTLFECMAEFVPEPTNPHDPNAIMVKVDGRQVGYLSRRDAAEYGAYISQAILQQGTGMCRAVIAGRANGETSNLGVFLHVEVSRR
jgi:HIRAN domain